MIRLIAVVARKAGWTDGEWLAHYHEQHGPLVAAATGFARNCRGYRQNSVLSGAGSPGWNGVTELWFDDLAAMQRAFAAPDYLARVRPDEDRFVDRAGPIIVALDPSGGGQAPLDPTLSDKAFALRPRVHVLCLRSSAGDPPRADASGCSGYSRSLLASGGGPLETTRGLVALDEYWFASPEQARAVDFGEQAGGMVLLATAHMVFGTG